MTDRNIPNDPMDPSTLEALRGSIAKWEGIVAGTMEDHGPDNCPLCVKFQTWANHRVNCDGCPVQERTGTFGCNGSPYEKYEEYGDRCEERDEAMNPDVKRSLAQAELDFLKSLLPAPLTALLVSKETP